MPAELDLRNGAHFQRQPPRGHSCSEVLPSSYKRKCQPSLARSAATCAKLLLPLVVDPPCRKQAPLMGATIP
eukprot:scaffold244834_cov18-Tisochrysis_lutea.AAC.1